MDNERVINDDRSRHLSGLLAHVNFKIPNELETREYQRFLVRLLSDFILALDARNEREAKVQAIFGRNWNSEGGIGGIYVRDVYLIHCKMYLFDGSEDDGSKYTRHCAKGLMFRDHDETIQDTAKVHDLADCFEEFLKGREIEYTRENLSR